MGLLWKDGDSRFEVESVAFKNGPNIVTFQLSPETINTTMWECIYHPIVTLGWMKFVRRWKSVQQDASQTSWGI